MNIYIILILSFINMVLSNVISNNIYKRENSPTYLTSNYTIDFVRNIEIEKCYTNQECPHYSNGCYIPLDIFNNTIFLNDGNYLRDKDYLVNNNIFGYCTYSFICPEPKNNNGKNNYNCFVQFNGEEEDNSMFIYYLPIHSFEYPLKESFTKTNVTTPYFCSDKSIRNKHCIHDKEIKCDSNNNCLTNNCQENKCLASDEYSIYECNSNVNKETIYNGIIGHTVCKKVDQEMSNEPSECLSNYIVEGFCFNKDDKSKIVFIFDSTNTLRIVLVVIIITGILIIIFVWALLRKIVLGKKQKIYRF